MRVAAVPGERMPAGGHDARGERRDETAPHVEDLHRESLLTLHDELDFGAPRERIRTSGLNERQTGSDGASVPIDGRGRIEREIDVLRRVDVPVGVAAGRLRRERPAVR